MGFGPFFPLALAGADQVFRAIVDLADLVSDVKWFSPGHRGKTQLVERRSRQHPLFSFGNDVNLRVQRRKHGSGHLLGKVRKIGGKPRKSPFFSSFPKSYSFRNKNCFRITFITISARDEDVLVPTKLASRGFLVRRGLESWSFVGQQQSHCGLCSLGRSSIPQQGIPKLPPGTTSSAKFRIHKLQTRTTNRIRPFPRRSSGSRPTRRQGEIFSPRPG